MTPGPFAGYDKEIQDGFIRQRRNLIAVSLVLWFVETSSLTLSKLNILGNEFPISNPAAVNHALWIAWVYWFVRYYQYFRHAHGIQQTMEAFHGHMYHPMKDLALARGRHVYPEPEFFVSIDRIASRSLGKWVARLVVDPRTSTSGTDKRILHDEPLSFRDLFMPRIRAAWYLVVRTRFVTEYILPFLVALIPLSFKIYQMTM